MKVMIIGANGQLGSDICMELKKKEVEVVEVNHEQMDIVNLNQARAVVNEHRPKIVISTAAMHNVERCEEDPIKSFQVNGVGARNLALLSNELDFTLIHFSTDYVFDGSKKAPYDESDCPRPLNVYGNSKLAGEYFVQTLSNKYFILRVSGLYGVNACRAKGGLNFVKLMLKLARERDEIRVVDDEVLTPTCTADVAKQVFALLDCQKYGLYHATAQGSCSWYRFAAKIFEITKTKVNLRAASPGEFPAKVPRPKYSVLENRNLQNLGLDTMPDWEAGLSNYLTMLS